ncbi:hypothetical protein EMPG_16586 [Blastomyces silverae]|uniref:Uncharacterized protein n=1 Tax=Blastomyces silverae TaxID=2060906 RepID=A0A0H1B924_9EURO|nr:hypothetical protein EMPG_16586 [Blastomyces silverae]
MPVKLSPLPTSSRTPYNPSSPSSQIRYTQSSSPCVSARLSPKKISHQVTNKQWRVVKRGSLAF